MIPNIKCKNQYTIRKVDAAGKETEVARFHNVPLQPFYNTVIGRNSQSLKRCIHSVWFGTGTREPSGSDTALESPLWTYEWRDSNCTAWEKYLNEDRHVCHKYTFKINADSAHVGTVSEVGVEIITGQNPNLIAPEMGLATRALILDTEGNPITITKTDLEALYVDVIFEFILQDTEDFKWLPENYINFGDRSGSGKAPIFTLGLYNRLYFLGRMGDNGFDITLTTLDISKTYASNNHELVTNGARLQQTMIPSQRYIKAIGIGYNSEYNSEKLILGYWKLPNANVIPPKLLTGMGVGTGDGVRTEFPAPIAEWVENSEVIYVNDMQQVRGVDYSCSHDANAQGLAECSILQNIEYIGEFTTVPLDVITPIIGRGPKCNDAWRAAKWMASQPTLTYAFPEDGVKAIKRFRLANFIAYTRISDDNIYYDSNWSGAVWTIEYSEDNTVWQQAGTVTINSSNVADITFNEAITARYWRFTISSKITGILFAADGYDSIMAYGNQTPIVFKTAPAEGAVIKMDATVDCPMKNENFIIDCNPTFEI